MLAAPSPRSERLSCVYPLCSESSISVELFNVHLSQCRRQWFGPMFVCPHNGGHILPIPEETYHSFTCPDRCKYGESLSKNVERPFVQAEEKASDETKEKFQRTKYQKGGNRYTKPWNLGPRLQKRFEMLDNMEEKLKKDEECETAVFASSSIGKDETVGNVKSENSYQFVGKSRGRGRDRGNRSFFRGGFGIQRQSFAHFRHNHIPDNALPTLSTATLKSDSDQSMTVSGFCPWSSGKSWFHRRYLRTVSASSSFSS